jgi:hypothetical protein
LTFQQALSRAMGTPAGTSAAPGQIWSSLRGSLLSSASPGSSSGPRASFAAIGVAARPAATRSAAGSTALPAASDAALSQAMALEGVPSSWQDGLRFIMAKESSGTVDARNPYHSARGLFQLTQANWHYNPNGAASFGDAVQEAQGGIRYIRQRYGSADNAVTFWRTHHWY